MPWVVKFATSKKWRYWNSWNSFILACVRSNDRLSDYSLVNCLSFDLYWTYKHSSRFAMISWFFTNLCLSRGVTFLTISKLYRTVEERRDKLQFTRFWKFPKNISAEFDASHRWLERGNPLKNSGNTTTGTGKVTASYLRWTDDFFRPVYPPLSDSTRHFNQTRKLTQPK